MSARDSNETKTLDTLRRRLLTISTNLFHFRESLSNPHIVLPPWPLILSTCQDLATNLADLQIFLQNNKAFENLDLHIPGYDVPHFLESAHVYPTSEFPVEQEGALGMLLSRRLAPKVEEWVDEALKAANEVNEQAARGEKGALSAEQLEKLWTAMVLETQDRAGHMEDLSQGEAGDDGDSGEDEDDEGEDDEMEDVGQHEETKEANPATATPMMKLEDVLKFMSTGSIR